MPDDADRFARPQRRRPVHGVHEAVGRPTIVFVTVCTKDRMPWLATCAVHAQLRQVWGEATSWAIGRYTILPDHVHLFAAPADATTDLDAWIRYWKSLFTRLHGDAAHRWQAGH